MTSRKATGSVLFLTLLLFLFLAIFHLGLALKGTPFFRDIHLGTALHYAANSISLKETVIVGFNATNAPTIQEIPLWQALTALVIKALGPWWGWGNFVSLLFIASGLYPLYQITARHAGPRAALWSLPFFLTQPVLFTYGAAGAVDGAALVLGLWYWYYGDRMLASPTLRNFALTAVTAVLSATMKLPFFFAFSVALGLQLLTIYRKAPRQWASLLGVGLLSTVVFFAWTHLTDSYQANALFPLVDLRISHNPDMIFWYFGDWGYRLNPANWVKGGWRLLNALFGSFVLVGLCLYGAFRAPQVRFALFGLLGVAVTTLIFSHLVLHHSHYYLMAVPAVAVLLGNGLARLEAALTSGGTFSWKGTALVGVLLGLSAIQGLIGMKGVLFTDPYPRQMAAIVREYTSPEEKLLVSGGGWGGEIFLRSGRQGLSIWNTEFLEKPENLEQLRKLGFTKLVEISESPLLHALQVTNPGQANRQREMRPPATPLTSGWPVVYESEDIIIRQIP